MKKTIIFLITIVIQLSILNCSAQNNKIDSLKKLIRINDGDTNQVVLLKELCRENRKIGEFEKALQYGNAAIALGKKIIIQNTTIDVILVTKNYVADSHNNIGIIYWNQGNYDKALESHFASIKIREEVLEKAKQIKNNLLVNYSKKGLAASYNNIGLVFETQNKYEKAIENYSLSLKIQDEIEDRQGIANTYNNIGVIYYNQLNYDKALENYAIAKKYYTEINDKQGLSSILSNEGVVYKNQGKYDLALAKYFTSLKLREEKGDKIGVANSYGNIGNLYLTQNNLTEAKKHLLISLNLSKEIGSKNDIMRMYEALAMCDSLSGNWKGSLAFYKLYKQFNDSIFNEESLEKTIEMSTRFESEKKEAQIKFLEKDKEKQAEISMAENKRQNAILLFIVVILLLVIVFSVFMSNRYRVTQKQKKQIEEQQIITDQQKQLVEEKNKEITDSIHYAKRIQAAILPPDKLVKEHLKDNFIIYKPKDIVAGDFYWVETINSGEYWVLSGENQSLNTQYSPLVLFAAADCTGHGVPGAMVSVVCNNALNRSVREYGLTNPGEILDKTREIVIQEFEKSDEEVKDGMDIALCSLRFEVQSCELKYAGANNPLWVIKKGATELIEIKPNKQPIGKYLVSQPFTTHTIELQKGDTIYIFSDGYADQFGGEKGKKFKLKSLKELILSVQYKDMFEQKQIIDKVFEDWKGNLDQIDDVCIIGVRV